MIHMKRVDRKHFLALDINTDKSHLFSFEDEQTPILTFDSNANCTDGDGNIVCRLSIDSNNNWISKNSLGIFTDPVSMNKMEGIFDVEAQFCLKWLELNTVKVD